MGRGKQTRVASVLSLILVCVIMTVPGLLGQSAAGTWLDANYNITLQLNANWTYSLQYPNGSSQGRFSINGNRLCLQDSRGGQPVCYTVQRFTANQMIMVDATGVTMNFNRQSGAAGPALPQGNTEAATNNNVLAQKDSFTLTGAHFQIGIDLPQFIIGHTVKPSEVKELKTQLIKEFNQSPKAVLNEFNSLAGSMQKIKSITDPLSIGYARQQLFTAFYKATRQMPEYQKPLMIQVINRYIKVMAYDEANNLALTNRDVDGMVKYLAFNSELRGQPIQLTPQLSQSVAQELVQKFSQMSIDQKKLLCSASLLWQLVEFNWNRLSSAQKQQYKNSFVAQVQPNYTPATPSASSNKPKSAAESMRNWNAKQQMFKMMMDMNTQSHVTSLNIIENMGGTGDYWKVVDY